MINFAKTSHHVVLAALLAAATIGAAHAITDSAFIYSPPRTGFYSIDSADLTPETHDVQYVSTNEFIAPTLMGTTSCFLTGVNLPHGATVTQFMVSFYSGDDPGGAQPFFALRRKQLSNGTNDTIAFRTIADDTATLRQANVPVDADFAVINNAQYSYHVFICLEGNVDRFYQGRLTYTYKHAGD